MPLTDLQNLIEHDLRGAEEALQTAETHPDLHSRVCFLERARLQLTAVAAECQRQDFHMFDLTIASLQNRMAALTPERTPPLQAAGF
ncbi:hypothetical protein [Deinococcus roseus]|uniref:Uncharacterized protein n=1 Tax=Deinococcus roseus TaxID=392414 RepID=A0ABQ2CWU8_9DEIO|nr:hypothetical protein [Deinococcus roseus]GGJ21615.1 hypothetical protein GCM10008938_04750 [Deinococcus roseus]